jgi:type I site-specific restriction endonuclease
MRGFPVLIVEAKAPNVEAEEGYREASLYARHLNQKYPADFNPCRFILSTNGRVLLFGSWDSNPSHTFNVSNLRVGSRELEQLRACCADRVLEAFGLKCLQQIRRERVAYPYARVGGAPC